MKWIGDDDERKIREARERVRWLDRQPGTYRPATIIAEQNLTEVLDNIHALAQEKPHPAPRIAHMGEDEMRKIYPERYTR